MYDSQTLSRSPFAGSAAVLASLADDREFFGVGLLRFEDVLKKERTSMWNKIIERLRAVAGMIQLIVAVLMPMDMVYGIRTERKDW